MTYEELVLGVLGPAWLPKNLSGEVDSSGAPEKGGILLGTGGMTKSYTELAMLGRNQGSEKTLDT